MIENIVEGKGMEQISYTEMSDIYSFRQAAGLVMEQDLIENVPRFLLIDIDGTLFDQGKSDKNLQYPIVSTFIRPFISPKNQIAFIELAHQFEGRISIVTNRNKKEDFLWNSNEVLAVVNKLIALSGVQIPIFDSMQKQLPRFFPGKVNELADYIEQATKQVYGESCKNIVLDSIQDASLICFNRKRFLTSVAKRLLEEKISEKGFSNEPTIQTAHVNDYVIGLS
jgi:hypothetical protein